VSPGDIACRRTLNSEINLRADAIGSQEMYDEQNDTHNESNMNETAGNVKCEKSEQPKNDKNSCDDSEHVFHRLSNEINTRNFAVQVFQNPHRLHIQASP
jgi:hypothetical protein